MDHPSVITEHVSGGSDRVSHRECEIINVTLPMLDGEGAFLFCAPGYESSPHERRRAVLCRKQNGDPLFLPPANSLTPRSFSFSRCRRRSTPRASPWLSTPYKGNAALPPAERAAAILAACRWLLETRALVFIENDAEFLLRRLPQDILSTHYHDDEGHIRALPEESSLCPRGGTALVAAAVLGLILTVSHQDQIGQLYPQVLSLLVHGACRELF